ncbi:MAG: hypothetical protein HY704_02215 [Gemmatimonadetes bacterium]|nr:hypothetical protein [Gemmatimonadota bacterium]
MQLLIAVINQPEKLDEILAGFFELGITGATVITSEGMGHVLSRDVPIFAGLRSLVAGARPENRTIFSVIEDDRNVGRAIELLQEVCGNLSDPATGIAFTLPITRVVGLKPALGRKPGEIPR